VPISSSSQPTVEIMLDGGSLSIEKSFGSEIEKELKS
jgi:hypothetical protein